MLFAFHGMDGKDGAEKRDVNYPAHHTHLDNVAKFGVTIVMSGPLLADDGKTPIGSLIIVDAPDRAAAETFYTSDPFYKAGVWEKTNITAFKKVKG